jgi:hypothetical protein
VSLTALIARSTEHFEFCPEDGMAVACSASLSEDGDESRVSKGRSDKVR